MKGNCFKWFLALLLILLTKEQQLLYSQITEMCIGPSEEKRNLALSSLETDPGFADLLAHFVSFITEGVRLNVNEQSMVNLIYLMRMVHAITVNPYLNIGIYFRSASSRASTYMAF